MCEEKRIGWSKIGLVSGGPRVQTSIVEDYTRHIWCLDPARKLSSDAVRHFPGYQIQLSTTRKKSSRDQRSRISRTLTEGVSVDWL